MFSTWVCSFTWSLDNVEKRRRNKFHVKNNLFWVRNDQQPHSLPGGAVKHKNTSRCIGRFAVSREILLDKIEQIDIWKNYKCPNIFFSNYWFSPSQDFCCILSCWEARELDLESRDPPVCNTVFFWRKKFEKKHRTGISFKRFKLRVVLKLIKTIIHFNSLLDELLIFLVVKQRSILVFF